MKLFDPKNRHFQHKTILGILIFTLALVIISLLIQIKSEKDTRTALENYKSPNICFFYGHKANIHFNKSQEHFSNYLISKKKEELLNYSNSVDTLKFYLDSLILFSKDHKNITHILDQKKVKDERYILIREKLDSILQAENNLSNNEDLLDFDLKKFPTEKVLKSVKYDSIVLKSELVRKNLLTRLGQAISGKYDVKKEELQLYFKVVYGESVKQGTIEDQLYYVFKTTEKFYGDQLNHIKVLYFDQIQQDQELTKLNLKIHEISSDVINNYLNPETLNAEKEYASFLSSFEKGQKLRNTTFYILILLISLSVAAVFYLIQIGFKVEKKLISLKTKLENNLRLKNRLIGMISHEIRAPIQVIQQKIKALKTENAKEEYEKSIASIDFNSQSVLLTANQILEFSKSENKSLEFLPSKINLKSDIEHIVESLKTLAENKGINLDMEVDQTLDEFFWTDTVKIHQLFFNLIGNAIKFTDKGYVKVNAKNFQNQLTVSIEDTGIGIPKEDISKIFDQFYQTGNADFRSNLGAGLGLHLCKEIISLLKGSLDIKSDYGKGSKISFTIPLEKYVDHNTCYLERLKEKLATQSINIALIDDDKLSIQLLNKILKPLNQNISLFDSLESFFNENIATFGLVLTDLNLKDGSGWDIAQRLKQQEDQNSIVIIVTGDSYWESADLEELPADEVLIKPVNKEELYKKIESLI